MPVKGPSCLLAVLLLYTTFLSPAMPLTAAAGMVDLSQAVIVVPPNLAGPEKKAVAMLREEVEKRSRILWNISQEWPADDVPAIVVGSRASLKTFGGKWSGALAGSGQEARTEGYLIRVVKNRPVPAVFVVGNDDRGVLYGVGHLLRSLVMERDSVAVMDTLDISSAPRYPLRGHQLGYRPKTNSYDGWTVSMWEQYIRDLVVFGTNAIELIPPRSDDAADSPHFPLPQMRMMQEMSRLLADYGLDVWIWYPALDKDYSDPKTVDFALNEWGEVFRRLPRVDAVFVPGGDPGHTQPKYMMALLEKETQVLRRYHPKAQMWVSPQGFDRQWMEEFYGLMKQEPAWLTGIVHGPQVRVSVPELRQAIPRKYPIRLYPDITHSLQCQYPVPDWDTAYAVTQAREVINPRPVDQTLIFRRFQSYASGFLTYSEGCNDDVNKIIWSSLGWNPDTDTTEILRDYSRYFIGPRYADVFAQALLALERNWRGPLVSNPGVYETFSQLQELERGASPQLLLNWRFQQALYRGYYDAFIRSRLLYETSLEDRALQRLREAATVGSLAALDQAETALNRAVTDPPARDWRQRVFELGEALYQSIRMQLSVPRYKAIAVGRGANLDTIDVPLNNRPWLACRFAEIRRAAQEQERLRAIREILGWADPGPGGFYDDLGNLTQQPHLVRGAGFEQDPAFLRSSLVGFGARAGAPPWRNSWRNHAESLNDEPLELLYKGLDRNTQYKVRITYAGENVPGIRLVADDSIEVHPFIRKPDPVMPVEFDIPVDATRDGNLSLKWYRTPGLGGNGRGCQVAEVWLSRKQRE